MKYLASTLTAALFCSDIVNAAVTIDIFESGGDIVATASGSLDISSLPLLPAEPPFSGLIAGSTWRPGQFDSVIIAGGGERDVYGIDNQSIVFSTGSNFRATTSSGDIVAIGSLTGSTNVLNVPQGYVSGSTLSGTSTWPGQTIASMGLIPGSYTFTWAADSVTVNILVDSYSVGGNISGLTANVTLQNNGGDDLVLSADGGFTFATPVNAGNPYSVTVSVQPAGQTCTVSNGSGTVSNADITNVQVVCVSGSNPAHPVPALPLSGLVLTALGLLAAAGTQLRMRVGRRRK